MWQRQAVCVVAFAGLIAGSSGAQVIQNETLRLLAPDGSAGDQFGSRVAVDGDTAVVGAPQDDAGAGTATVFVRQGSDWVHLAQLGAVAPESGALFGSSVAIDGDLIVVGEPGAERAHVFARSGDDWTLQATLTAIGGRTSDLFGSAVGISGDTAVVGAPYHDANGIDSGVAYAFERQGELWSQTAELCPNDSQGHALDHFGATLGIDGDVAVVGAPDAWFNQNGVVDIYRRSGSTWAHVLTVVPSDFAHFDHFGSSVGVSGSTLAVGAPGNDDRGSNAGTVYVFQIAGGTATQVVKLYASDAQALDRFGSSCAIRGDLLVSGATHEDGQDLNAGAAYLFRRMGSTWTEQAKLLASDGAQADRLGVSVAVSPDVIVAGAARADALGEDSGAAYLFSTQPSECFLVIGDGPGVSLFSASFHEFETQIGPAIEQIHAISLESLPQFVLPAPGMTTSQLHGPQGQPTTTSPGPAWLQDGRVCVQVLMWNPGVFPALPEQSSTGLAVLVLPDGDIRSAPFGIAIGGLHVWAEVDIDSQGQRVLRFPFSIQGL